MTRRRIVETPVSKLALWSRRLAVFALAVAALSVIVVRAGFIEIFPGIVTLGGAFAIAVCAIVLAFGAFIVVWNHGYDGLRFAVQALAIGIGLLAYPAYLGIRGYGLPELNDISTDTSDPPQFEAIARLRPREANPIAYPGQGAADLQATAYPDIEPLQLNASPRQVFDAALNVITHRKWLIVEVRVPQPSRRDGHIEAIARTMILGLRDDVVVRVRSDGTGTRLDVRSASRYGRRDFGANARRVRDLLTDIDEAVSAQTVPGR